MSIFAGTSGFFALLVHDDFMHMRAQLNFEYDVRFPERGLEIAGLHNLDQR